MTGEDKITNYFAKQSKLNQARFPIGIGDDMAMVADTEKGILITTDMLLAGVHFDLTRTSIEQVGYKAMAASLSDCAAMATIPICAVVSVALGSNMNSDDLKELHAGIVKAGDSFGCSLVGGDITSWNDRFAITVTMLSEPADCSPVRRDTAKVGDFICVTGTLGGSILGKHLEFTPRVKEALAITAIVDVNSMMDITDGLTKDLNRICNASSVCAVIEQDAIPLSQAAHQQAHPIDAALNDGEDFELLFTLSPENYETLEANWNLPLEITAIGQIESGNGVYIKNQFGEKKQAIIKGFDHIEK